MKTFLIVFSVIVAVYCNEAYYTKEESKEFEDFKKNYSRKYSPVEEKFRKLIFVHNLHDIIAQNKLYKEGKSTWEAGINQFTDILGEEVPTGYIPRNSTTLRKA